MSQNNTNLHKAKAEENDEFYTRLEDIEEELTKYGNLTFKDKVVYCNCDNALHSNFFQYFIHRFNIFGLKQLICTCYDDDSSLLQEKEDLWGNLTDKREHSNAYKIVVNKVPITESADKNTYDNFVDKIKETIISGKDSEGIKQGYYTIDYLSADDKYKAGDFRSKECIKLLKQSDIVVTNPPFSLFREFISTLEEYNKKYIIIGPQNAITYKEIFPLIKNNKMWLGYTHVSQFILPNGEIKTFGNILWFTNVEVSKRKELLPINPFLEYNEKDYPKYDNYDAINVDKIKDIPDNYYGVIGVPITFLDKYNPEQFEIIGHEHDINGNGGIGVSKGEFEINGIGKYKRILIRRIK